MSTLRANAIQTLAGKPIVNSTGSILQVIQTIKTDGFSTATNSNSGVSITGLSATITPSSTSNTILVAFTAHAFSSAGYSVGFSLWRNGTLIGNGIRTSDSTTPLQQRVSAVGYVNASPGFYAPCSFTFLDTPNTTSSITYQINIHNDGRSTTVYLNNNNDSSNNTYVLRPASTITLTEVSG
jgi:hypothetical protein